MNPGSTSALIYGSIHHEAKNSRVSIKSPQGHRDAQLQGGTSLRPNGGRAQVPWPAAGCSVVVAFISR